MYVSPCWLANIGVSIGKSLLENFDYEFVRTSSAVSSMSDLSYLDGLRDEK